MRRRLLPLLLLPCLLLTGCWQDAAIAEEEPYPEDLTPQEEEVIPLPEEDKYCPYCNSKMEYVTEMFVREELRITPAKVERIHYYQEKWQCPECR